MDQMTIADLEGCFLEIGCEDRERITKIVLAGGLIPPGTKYEIRRKKDGLLIAGGFDSYDACREYAETFVYRVRMLFLNPMGH